MRLLATMGRHGPSSSNLWSLLLSSLVLCATLLATSTTVQCRVAVAPSSIHNNNNDITSNSKNVVEEDTISSTSPSVLSANNDKNNDGDDINNDSLTEAGVEVEEGGDDYYYYAEDGEIIGLEFTDINYDDHFDKDDNDDDDDDDDEYDDYTDDDDEDDEDMDLWPVLCPPDTYYSLDKDTCVACTPCPANTVAVEKCARFDDNLCLPIPTFYSRIDGYRRGGNDNNNVYDGDDDDDDDYYGEQNDNHDNDFSYNTQFFDNNNSNNNNNNDATSMNKNDPSQRVDDHPDDYLRWKSVSLSLLVCTCVVFLCLVTVGSVFFYLRRRARAGTTTTKEILCSYSPAPAFPIVKVAEV